MLSLLDVKELTKAAREIRKIILSSAYNKSGGHHLGGGLSMVEIMCYLYGKFLNVDPSNKFNLHRDRFILSKGHGVLGLYPTLTYYGFINKAIMDSYKTIGSELISHPIKNLKYGIESSNGSLGHGLSYGSGIAHGLKSKSSEAKVVVLVGDGECNEGSVWEAIMSAATLKLSNLYLVVDFNRFQSDGSSKEIIDQSNLSERISSFGWSTQEVDGHSFKDLHKAFNCHSDKPKAIISRTIKGKGIEFMEENNSYHHSSVTEEIFIRSMNCLESEQK